MDLISFLNEAKKRILAGKLDFIPRAKNITFLQLHGLTPLDVEDILLNITTNDFFSGPVPDISIPSEEVWVFKKYIESEYVYIKIKLRQYRNSTLVDDLVCISLHTDES